jgi:hypothetical protein
MSWGSEVYRLDDYLVQERASCGQICWRREESCQMVGMAKGYPKGAL